MARFRNLESAKAIVSRCFCGECGKIRVLTPSGAVCPDHKLVLGITSVELKQAAKAKELAELPLAMPVTGYKTRCRFTINGMDGEFRPRKTGDVVACDASPKGLQRRTFVAVKSRSKPT